MNMFSTRPWKRIISIAALSGLLVGCATSPKIDWDARVGAYTHDQAVTELGPPDKSATLTDGTAVAEWLISRNAGHSVLVGPFPYSRSGYAYPTYSVDNFATHEWFLRLTFGPDGALRAWKKYSK